jgi:hypothetical protein
MSTITFDTLQYVDTLTSAGVPEAQAKAMAKAQAQAIESTTDIRLATKGDIQDLKLSIVDIRKDMAELKSEMMRALLIQVFAIAGLVIAVVKFMN